VRVVLDTNFWVSALVYSSESSMLHQILQRFLAGGFELVTSSALHDEFVELCIRHKVAKPVLEKYSRLMQHTSTEAPPYVRHVEPTDWVDAITADPDDNRLLECAVEGKADMIVSGDKHLINLAIYENIPILSPRDFIERMNREG
jgi:uncharacterized protein